MSIMIKPKPPKPKICKNPDCKEKFIPTRAIQPVCSRYECMVWYANRHLTKRKQEIRQADKKKTKEIKERLKTHSEHIRELQEIFNTFIRLRDKHRGCISCHRELMYVKYDAGHYFSVGASPELRFNEDNAHGQCVRCNQHEHANLIQYTENLIQNYSRKLS